MTTDNRTNEPTPEQVEAAAKAMWDLRKLISDPEWDALEYGVKREYRKDARAALVAAQGAAPQAEGECRCTPHYEDRGGGHTELVLEPEPTCPEHGRGLVALALPSSTVDEEAIAARICEKNYVSPDGKPYCQSCLEEVRAVVEAIGGEG